jgi:hypothetical protein
MRLRSVLFAFAILATLIRDPLPGPRVTLAQAGCQFLFGFKALHDQIPAVVGPCLGDETHNPDNGDGLQQTLGGLLVWRKADNWTAFTNGAITWLNGPCGLQTRPNQGPFYPWEGRPGADCSGSGGAAPAPVVPPAPFAAPPPPPPPAPAPQPASSAPSGGFDPARHIGQGDAYN